MKRTGFTVFILASLIVTSIIGCTDKPSTPEFEGVYIQSDDNDFVEIKEISISSTGSLKLAGKKRFFCINESERHPLNIVEIDIDDFQYVVNKGKSNSYFTALHKANIFRFPEDTETSLTGYGDKQSWYCSDNYNGIPVNEKNEGDINSIKPKSPLSEGIYYVNYYGTMYIFRLT